MIIQIVKEFKDNFLFCEKANVCLFILYVSYFQYLLISMEFIFLLLIFNKLDFIGKYWNR